MVVGNSLLPGQAEFQASFWLRGWPCQILVRQGICYWLAGSVQFWGPGMPSLFEKGAQDMMGGGFSHYF